MKISKIYLRVCSLLFVCFLVCGSILRPVVTYASLYDLMIGSSSNALMTLELDDMDYLMMSPRSSVGTVANTVDECRMIFTYTNGTYVNHAFVTPVLSGGRYQISWTIPDYMAGYWLSDVIFEIQSKSENFNGLPRPSGNYYFSMDCSSDFSYGLRFDYPIWNSMYRYENSVYDSASYSLTSFSFESGDFYIAPTAFNIKSGYWYNRVTLLLDESEQIKNWGGSFAMRFEPTNVDGLRLAGDDVPTSDLYEDNVSSSLSDLSSSVDTMTDEISGVTEAIQNLQGAMEPHYSNVLTQLHHITEQLHAFYDQIYNNIHLKEYALWQDIKTAIENIDLEVNVNLDKLKSSIDNMSTAVQNKLQSVSDQITGGFDNSGMTQENEKLEQSINQYDEVESGIFEDAEGFIGDFEYPSVDNLPLGIIKALAFIGSILQGIFLSMGDFSVIITFSLTMIFVMVIVGYHRIRS